MVRLSSLVHVKTQFLILPLLGTCCFACCKENCLFSFLYDTKRYPCPPHFNPADFIIDTVSQPGFTNLIPTLPQQTGIFFNPLPFEVSVTILDNFVALKRSTNYSYTDLEGVDEYATSFLSQFQILTNRTFVHALRYR